MSISHYIIDEYGLAWYDRLVVLLANPNTVFLDTEQVVLSSFEVFSSHAV
jgi:hypothetical protein